MKAGSRCKQANIWKMGKTKYLEFAQDIFHNFTHWCTDSLCDLIVLEQFNSTLPAHFGTYINEKKVKTPSSH